MTIDSRTILLGTKKLTFGDLRQLDSKDFTPFERSVVEHCKEWMSDATGFEVTTSGSTGDPKKINFHRSQLEASARLTAEALGLKEGMTALLCLNPGFIAGKMMIIRCMVTGMNLIAVEPMANPLDHLPQEAPLIDFAAMVPLQVRTIINSNRAREFDQIRMVIIGGGQVDPELREKLQTLPTSFYSTFGMTETISHVALQKLNGVNQDSYMQALPGVTFSTDSRGCLVIHAPHAEQQSIVTNDMVELIDSGKFRWLGRWDNVINSGGIKIIPEVAEQAIAVILPAIGIDRRFFVHGVDHPSLGQEVGLVIEGSLDRDKEESVLTALKEQLPKYSSPRKILYAGNFVFTSTGKIRRKESFELASPRPGV